MAFNIVWTDKAKLDRKLIFSFWNWHNQSTAFSRKLNKSFNKQIESLPQNPTLGKLTNHRGIRYLIVRSFFIFYSISENHIILLRIWDSRQDPEKMESLLRD